jgi:hypothetical protein
MSDEYPSLELAYEYVLPSYEWAMSRSDMLEQRLQDSITLITTVTLAVPVLATAIVKQIDLLVDMALVGNSCIRICCRRRHLGPLAGIAYNRGPGTTSI